MRCTSLRCGAAPLPVGVCVVVFLAAAIAGGHAPSGTPAGISPPLGLPPSAVYPAAEWDHAKPEAARFSSPRLAVVRDHVRKMATTSMVVVAGGRIIFEYGDISEVSYIASVRKSVLAVLYGTYIEKGTIRLNKTLAELDITDIGGLSQQELQATVGDLLAARSGVYHPASNPGDNLADAPPRGSQRHGTYFLYSNWDFNALGTIFEQETGKNIYDSLEADLARPIGMQDFDRSRHEKSGDATRSIHLAYHMHLSTRDMARVGYLMLREGRWRDQQIVPRAWTKRIVTPVTRNTEMNPASSRGGPFGYGFLWWVLDGKYAFGAYERAYTAIGAGGQFITVLPALDLVVAHKVRIPPADRTVSPNEYFTVIDELIAARSSQ